MDSAKLLLEKQRLCQKEISIVAGILQGSYAISITGGSYPHLLSKMLYN